MEWIAEGRVRVDGKRAPKGSPVQAGARISVERPPPDQPAPQPELPIRIVHADAHLVVADKPAGMPSHPLKPGERGTAANALVGRFPELAQVGPSPREGGLVHRLDSETSGLLLAARTEAAHSMLRAQFTARAVDKGYLALAAGEIHAGGEIALPLLHDSRDPRRMQAASDATYAAEHGARAAVTRFLPIERTNRFSTSAVNVSTYGFVSGRLTPARASIVACQGEPWITRKLVPSVAVVLASHSYAYAASSLSTFGASAASVRGPSSDESV